MEKNELDFCNCKNEKDSLHFYWRETQRKQIGISANIIFLFSSAILGFLVNNTYTHCKCCFDKIDICVVISSMSFLILSLFFYILFTINRLYDFRKTAKLYKEGKSTKEVENVTHSIGKRTWLFFYGQLLFLLIGFVYVLIYYLRYLA